MSSSGIIIVIVAIVVIILIGIILESLIPIGIIRTTIRLPYLVILPSPIHPLSR